VLRQSFSVVFYALLPLLVLFTAICLSCLLAFVLIKIVGDVISFQKMISKFTQLLLILSIFPTMKLLNINKAELGFAPRPIFFKQIGLGIVLGLLTLLPIFFALWLLKINVFDDSKLWALGFIVKKFSLALLMALLVSLIEEPLFRGILITGLSKKMPTILAVIISAFYYSALHFLDNNVEIAAKDVHLLTGFQLISGAVANVFNPYFLSSLTSLMMVGIFLGVIRTQLNTSLGICIGCHACWVWQIKTSKILFTTNTASEYIYLVGYYDAIIGPLVTGWLFLEVIKYFFYRYLNQ
jgi:uncharacterized protein